MKIKIFRLRSTLANEQIVKKMNDDFLKELDIECANVNNDNFSYVLVESGGTESLFVELLPKLNKNIILLTNGENNSLPASLEILTYLNNKGYVGEILHGSIKQIKNKLEKINSKHINFGLIGEPSDWLIASSVDEIQLKKLMNAQLIKINYEEFIKEYDKRIYEKNDRINELINRFNSKDLDNSLCVYGAIKRLIKKYNLQAITIRCFDLISIRKATACIALALLNEEGIVATCEGDVTTMTTMFFAKKYLNQNSFQANPSLIDEENQNIIFAHCTIPFDMLDNYTLDTHFESDLGLAISGNLKKEKVTVFKLSNDLKNAFIKVGTIKENLHNPRRCRTQIKVHFDENISEMLHHPFGNHHIIIYGDYYDKIIRILNK